MTGRAAIIGGGMIGGGWAARFALMGWEVRVFDPDPETKHRIEEVMSHAARVLPMLYEVQMPERGTVTYTASVADAVHHADWIQESVPERLETKQRVIRQCQAACPPQAMFASSTSTFKLSELQDGAARPEQIIVAHPFVPVYLVPLVEVLLDGRLAMRAKDVLTGIGMVPLHVRSETSVADGLLDGIWQEALSLIRDGIATTEDPVSLIAEQSEAQSGHLSIRDLERQRDHTLVAVIRALKQQGSAAGRVILDHEAVLRRPPKNKVPLVTVRRIVPIDWTDINGHMNESRYGQVFSDASEEVMTHIGADREYIAAGHSYFTVESTIKYLAETHSGEDIYVTTRVVAGQGKKLKLWHQMHRASDDRLLATCDQFLLHVSLDTRRSCPPLPHVSAALDRLARAHSGARS